MLLLLGMQGKFKMVEISEWKRMPSSTISTTKLQTRLKTHIIELRLKFFKHLAQHDTQLQRVLLKAGSYMHK